MENAKIYKIINDVNDKIYIGSSTYQYLCNRMNIHRMSCKDTSGRRNSKLYIHMREIGIEHFKIELIEKYECKTKEELKEREQYWIEQIKPELNMFRSIANPNYEKECRNKEEKKKKCNEYYYLHKEEILTKGKEKITCECGKIISKNSLRKHKKICSNI